MTQGHSGNDNPVAKLVVASKVVPLGTDLHSLWRDQSSSQAAAQ